jgi:uncharacterized membrane protein
MSQQIVESKVERARQLSHQWRQSSAGFLTERRATAALSAVALGAMTLIALYQLGILKHLPEPPLPGLDADRVDSSPEAYKRLGIPDAVLGAGSYAATMALAAVGNANRAQEQPWLPLALAAKAGFDVAQALRLTFVQWTRFRAFCFWCLLTAGTSFATAPLVFGEARAALRELGRKN